MLFKIGACTCAYFVLDRRTRSLFPSSMITRMDHYIYMYMYMYSTLCTIHILRTVLYSTLAQVQYYRIILLNWLVRCRNGLDGKQDNPSVNLRLVSGYNRAGPHLDQMRSNSHATQLRAPSFYCNDCLGHRWSNTADALLSRVLSAVKNAIDTNQSSVNFLTQEGAVWNFSFITSFLTCRSEIRDGFLHFSTLADYHLS